HTLCEQNSDALIETINAVEEKFGPYIKKMKWVNFGGGHHITRKDYDVLALIECIKAFKEKYNVEVYLEPGEAIALDAGVLVSKVIDIIHNEMDIAIMDTSAACHMPDVLEMPYRPNDLNAKMPNELKYTFRLAGPTCLAGDVISDYSFDYKLKTGDIVVFCDMAIYTMVKNNTFNGMPLPSIYLAQNSTDFKLVKKFGYEDFKNRLS
nr:carboxynorspermidine decarboxylase [Clostridia bacterium]